MLSKGVLIAGVLAAAASAPVTIPAAIGEPVSMTLGPFEIVYERNRQFDLDLLGDCLVSECPMFEIKVGEPQHEFYRIGF